MGTGRRRLQSRLASTTNPDETAAVREIRDTLGDVASSGVVFFASAKYDIQKLGQELSAAFQGCGPILGCTTAGQIGPGGFQRDGIVAAGLASPQLTIRPYVLSLGDSPAGAARAIAERVAADARGGDPTARRFGVLLVDGLCGMEELVAAALYRALGDIPIVGGSAADDLEFKRTYVYADGKLVSNAAVFAVFTTTLPFAPIKLQHFVASDRKLVVTRACPKSRTVYEINGEPAAEAYAGALGVPVESLDASVFSRHPFVRSIRREPYIRSIARSNADRSLTFFCAVEEGVVVSIGRSLDALETLSRELAATAEKVASPELLIGCDCILRRLELEHSGLDAAAGEIFARHRTVAFSSYGEQFNALHVNQTFTGVLLGG